MCVPEKQADFPLIFQGLTPCRFTDKYTQMTTETANKQNMAVLQRKSCSKEAIRMHTGYNSICRNDILFVWFRKIQTFPMVFSNYVIMTFKDKLLKLFYVFWQNLSSTITMQSFTGLLFVVQEISG